MRHFFTLLLLLLAAASAAQDRVAICILARDEGPFLAEFLDFYKYGGVTKAFVYVDDATADDTWAVLEPYIKSEYVEAFAWPPRPGSEIAAEIERKGWTNAFEPFTKTRHFVAAKGRTCTFYKGKPSHCAGHFQASSHCVGRARAAGFDWIGLIDPDEFWFSPRYGTLPSLLSAERERGSVGVGQNAFVYGPGGVDGACHTLGPITTTHLLRGNASRVEHWSKFPWVRLDAVDLNRVKVHEHTFSNYWCHTKMCRGASHNPLHTYEYKNKSCCDAVARLPDARSLRLNHYQYKSLECSKEKARRNANPSSLLSPQKEALLEEVYDDAILPFIPPKYKELCLKNGRHCHQRPASTFIDVRDTRRLQTKSVGVCVVLTHFVYTDSRGRAHEGDLRDLAALLASLKGQGVRRCLVSDFVEHRVKVEERLRRLDRDAVVDDWHAALTRDEIGAIAPSLFARWNTSKAFPHVLVHYFTKILSYDRPPYDVTLYLDDDMYACFDIGSLGDALLELAETGPVRLSDRRLSQGEASVEDAESRRVARWLHDGRPPRLWRRFDLQGGAVLLKRSPEQRKFAAAARQAFVDLWRAPFTSDVIASVNGTDAYQMVEKAVSLRRKRSTDQPALDLGAARLLVEDGVEIDALPTNYNFKIAPCDPHHDMRRQALGAAHLVRGPVRLIHHKNLKHPHTLCKLVNAAALAPRVVVGATACAMREPNEIRVHEISDGSPWLD